MGVYNPHIPQILGEEWVPIRNEDKSFSPAGDFIEVGHGFTLNSAKAVTDARFYLDNWPDGIALSPMMFGIYPRGAEDRTGPVQRVVIPVNAGGVTGAATSLSTSAAFAMYRPDGSQLSTSWTSTSSVNLQAAEFFFAANQYPILQGKRIVGVNLLYQGYAFNNLTQTPIIDTDVSTALTNVYIRDSTLGGSAWFGSLSELNFGPGGGTNAPVGRVHFGDINYHWDPTLVNITSDVMPWRYRDIQRFEATASPRLRVYMIFQLPNDGDSLGLDYVGLEVLYCEETRLAYGGKTFAINMGANPITLRAVESFNVTPTLPVGDYTLTLAGSDSGDASDGSRAAGPIITTTALRELYEIPAHPGIEITPTRTLGETFTAKSTHILPQLTLHGATGVLPEIHVYGYQGSAQVWGSLTPLQHIDDDVVTAAPYPQVRYYARRFGDTTVPLTLDSTTITGAGLSVSITPSAFDALDEIVDGWKEVTLRFPVAPTMGGLTPNPRWRWSATGELAGNRWEVLVAQAPAVSGVPGNLLQPAVQQLSSATYNAPNAGSTVLLNWINTPASGTADDPTADAVLMFALDPPTVTGVAVSLQSQALTGFADCGHTPCCIPTALSYNQITWPYRQTNVLYDAFERNLASTWGTASSGQAWGVGLGFSVTGGVGRQIPPATNTYYISDLGMSLADVTGSYRVNSSVAASGADHWTAVTVRGNTSSNQLYIRVGFETNGTVTLYLSSVVAGAHTTLATMVWLTSYTPGTWINVRFSLYGNRFQAKAWLDGTTEPIDWMLTTQVTNAANQISGTIGTRSIVGTGGTIPTFSYDNLTVTDLTLGYMELQRFDSVESTWQTIMQARNPALAIFNDYEARVGIVSSYRMRQVNVLGFAGLWSVTGTSTVTEPGVTMPACGTTKRGILMFTTNEDQDGSSNLAYAMAWEDAVSEDFSFPEVSGLELSQQFDRDFQVAFHGSERGGEVFQRQILLANAAIPLPRLANMVSIRDLAWADYPYVCVRDDIGDRWLSAIVISDSRVRRNRRLYNAALTVVEVTDTPSPVNP